MNNDSFRNYIFSYINYSGSFFPFVASVPSISSSDKERNREAAKEKNKKSKEEKKIAKIRQKLIVRKRKRRRNFLLFLIFAGLLSGIAGFVSYYQSMNLTENDSDSIVRGYYLLNDFESQLTKSASESESEEKLGSNIRYLVSLIASYGTKRASTLNDQEGQKILNRYYKAMQEIGTNGMKVSGNFYGNPALVEEYQQDIQKVKAYQSQVFTFYKIDEAALKQEAAD